MINPLPVQNLINKLTLENFAARLVNNISESITKRLDR